MRTGTRQSGRSGSCSQDCSHLRIAFKEELVLVIFVSFLRTLAFADDFVLTILASSLLVATKTVPYEEPLLRKVLALLQTCPRLRLRMFFFLRLVDSATRERARPQPRQCRPTNSTRT